MFFQLTFRALIFSGLVSVLLGGVSSASLLLINGLPHDGSVRQSNLIESMFAAKPASTLNSTKPQPKESPAEPDKKLVESCYPSSMEPTGTSVVGAGGLPCFSVQQFLSPQEIICLYLLSGHGQASWPSPPILDLLKIPIAKRNF